MVSDQEMRMVSDQEIDSRCLFVVQTSVPVRASLLTRTEFGTPMALTYAVQPEPLLPPHVAFDLVSVGIAHGREFQEEIEKRLKR
jgi:hypothetical protein